MTRLPACAAGYWDTFSLDIQDVAIASSRLRGAMLVELAAAVDIALSIGTPNTNAIRRIVSCRAEGLGEPFILDGVVYQNAFTIDPPDQGAYSALAESGT